MTTHEFEISFVVDSIEDPFDDRIEAAMDRLPGTVVAASGDLTIATVLISGNSAVESGLRAAKELTASGIGVQRSYPDLVSRQDIADRMSVTRQAVGNWVRRERQSADPFPAPITMVSGGAWLWGDVVNWLRLHGHDVDEAESPSLKDHNRIDRLIEVGVSNVTLSTSSSIGVSFSSGYVSQYRPSESTDYLAQGSYGLAS